MKRYINNTFDPSSIDILTISSILFVDDVESENPRDYAVYASSKIDYSALTREQLLQLPKKELESIRDPRILRKLKLAELTPVQYMEVRRANEEEQFQSTVRQIKHALHALKECPAVYRKRTVKNDSFARKLNDMGARITDADVMDIVSELHVNDYSYSKYSYLSDSWCSILMVFEYSGEHSFSPIRKGDDPVIVSGLDIYIKIDVDTITSDGYAVLSFHEPDSGSVMKHPHSTYPISKE